MASTVKTFRQAWSEALGLAPDAFEEAVLWRCLPSHHRFIGKLRWHLSRAYFNKDLELLRAAADCTTPAEVRREIEYHRSIGMNKGFQRSVLKARVSGQRLLDLAHKHLPPG
jgi:hypothetical protein